MLEWINSTQRSVGRRVIWSLAAALGARLQIVWLGASLQFQGVEIAQGHPMQMQTCK